MQLRLRPRPAVRPPRWRGAGRRSARRGVRDLAQVPAARGSQVHGAPRGGRGGGRLLGAARRGAALDATRAGSRRGGRRSGARSGRPDCGPGDQAAVVLRDGPRGSDGRSRAPPGEPAHRHRGAGRAVRGAELDGLTEDSRLSGTENLRIWGGIAGAIR